MKVHEKTTCCQWKLNSNTPHYACNALPLSYGDCHSCVHILGYLCMHNCSLVKVFIAWFINGIIMAPYRLARIFMHTLRR